jgi:hypothetical protein
MKRLFQLAIMIGVALAVPVSPLLLAQVQKAETPPPTAVTTVKTVVIEKKAVDLKKADAKGAIGIEAKGAIRIEAKRAAIRDAMVVQKAALPAAVAANNDPQVQQFIQQFRPAMRAEYYFIRTICAPSADQRKLIAREGEKALREASKSYADVQGRPVQVRNGRALYPDPRKLIEDAMVKAIKPQLTPEQAAKYQAESDKRGADRKQAATRNFVAKLDQDLVLGPEQREKIAAAIAEHWDETWCQSIETLLYGDQFYPRLPDNLVVPYLDAKQKDVWNGTRNNQNYFFGFVGNMLPDEDPKEDKELVEAREDTVKRHPAPAGGPAGNGFIVAPAPAAVRLAPAKAVAPPKAVEPAKK